MRIKTEIWVKAYVRRMAAEGAFATIVRRGDEDFGAVLVLVRRLDGTATLLGPAPRPVMSDDGDAEAAERRFIPLHAAPTVPESEAEALIERHRRFDADVWVIEVESRAGAHGLDVVRQSN